MKTKYFWRVSMDGSAVSQLNHLRVVPLSCEQYYSMAESMLSGVLVFE